MAEFRDVTEFRAWVVEHIAESPYGPREVILGQIDAAPPLQAHLGYTEGFRDGCQYARDYDRTHGLSDRHSALLTSTVMHLRYLAAGRTEGRDTLTDLADRLVDLRDQRDPRDPDPITPPKPGEPVHESVFPCEPIPPEDTPP